MPETTLGLFPDIDASYFLSRLPRYFGEYVGLAGVRLDGAEMLACGLATYFIPSTRLGLLQESLLRVDHSDPFIVCAIIDQFSQWMPLKESSAYNSCRLDIIDRCFSKRTVEEILSALEQEAVHEADEWISAAIESLKKASLISLKISLRSISVEGNLHVKVVKLNRPQKYNAITYPMELQLMKLFKAYERDPNVKLVILKGSGKVFSAGGDVTEMVRYVKDGHWTFGAHAYKKKIQLLYTVAKYKKSQVSLISGLNVGLGVALCVLGRFRVVTENTALMMPEAALGHFPDVGASYFLSRLPGFFGEYIGLTGARLDGAEMVACGLATHFVFLKNLPLLEEALYKVDTEDPTVISAIINQYTLRVPLKKDSAYRRLDLINKCFSKGSVGEILYSLEHESVIGKHEWITAAIKSIKMASPTKLELFLRSIREGRQQDIAACLVREYRMLSHVLRRTVCSDFYEGVRAKLLDKDDNPKWEPSKLELVTKDMLDTYFTKLDEDEGWEDLQLPCMSIPPNSPRAKL